MSDEIRIASVNMVAGGSTGHIMTQVARLARERGMLARTFSTQVFTGKAQAPLPEIDGHKIYGWYMENLCHTILGKATGYNGFFSYFGTHQLIAYLKKFKPHIIHLHNLHQFCVHLPSLFSYIQKNHICVVWTLHDCWSFTGHCCHFSIAGCDKWKTGCSGCPQYGEYPKTYIDRSKQLYNRKKKMFTSVENMTLVTPSNWLADLVRSSFLKNYPIRVINNGIDLSVFRPTESAFRSKYECENKKILLGVSFAWGYAKGLDVFIELSKRLDDHYKIVLVGTDEQIDRELPFNIISIHRTENRQELAGIYTAADLFINPTREDTFPTVNMEAIACGTRVLTFDTGGSPETVPKGCGEIVACGDVDAMVQKIKKMCAEKFDKAVMEQGIALINSRCCFERYIELYQEIMTRTECENLLPDV